MQIICFWCGTLGDMFAEAENDCAVRTILKMEVDRYLTPEEIAEREKMP